MFEPTFAEDEAEGRAGANALRVFLEMSSNFRIRSAQVVSKRHFARVEGGRRKQIMR